MIATTLTVLMLLGGGGGGSTKSMDRCMERCNSDSDRCSQHCGTSQKCMDQCSRRSQSCLGGCSGEIQKAEDRDSAKRAKMPCKFDKETRTVTPCTDEEVKAKMDLVKSKTTLCKDANGDPTPCEGDAEKTQATLKKYNIKLDCTDKSGMPIECPAK